MSALGAPFKNVYFNNSKSIFVEKRQREDPTKHVAKPLSSSLILIRIPHSPLHSCLCTEPDGVRLVGGTNNCSGTLEMKHQRLWRPVKVWNDRNLETPAVVCKQLDCGSAVSIYTAYGSTVQTAWRLNWNYDDSCVGSSLQECGQIEPWRSTEAVEVICSGN